MGGTGCERESALSAPEPPEQFPGSDWPWHRNPKTQGGNVHRIWVTWILFWTQNSVCSEEGCDESKGTARWEGSRSQRREANAHKGCSDTWTPISQGEVGRGTGVVPASILVESRTHPLVLWGSLGVLGLEHRGGRESGCSRSFRTKNDPGTEIF